MFLQTNDFWRDYESMQENGVHVLKETAVRLCSCVREFDTVSRVGGDEFWILLTNMPDKGSIIAIAENLIEAVAAPYKLQGEQVTIGASIGVALYPDHGVSPQELVNLADQTMYEIKRQGKNNYAFADVISELNVNEVM